MVVTESLNDGEECLDDKRFSSDDRQRLLDCKCFDDSDQCQQLTLREGMWWCLEEGLNVAISEVQEDLQQLKEKLQDISQGWKVEHVEDLEAAIEKTESGLRKHTERYLNAINASVLTISSSDNAGLSSKQISGWK
uniref:Uncharacterized protein n=1 Tax=Sphaerodactylus townsendi TaxID=933632 RepID=A0ACB8E503_9SAUR